MMTHPIKTRTASVAVPPPAEIEVFIDELVLHGFAPDRRWEIADALAAELRGLLATRGLPAAWRANPERLDVGAVTDVGAQSQPAAVGARIARAIIHDGGERGGEPR